MSTEQILILTPIVWCRSHDHTIWELHVQCYADFLTSEAVAVDKSVQSLLVETVLDI